MSRFACFLFLAGSVHAQGRFPAGDEVLRYDVRLPNGSAIGTATFEAVRVKGAEASWHFRVHTNFSLPGIPVEDTFRSLSANFCSAEFEKDSLHGSKKTAEIVVFYPERQKAVRSTKGGGMSSIQTGPCPKDPVNVLYHTRVELGKGRKPFTGTTVFGAAYEVKMDSRGKKKIEIGGKDHQTELVAGSYRGPKSKGEFEIYFSRDETRTPLVLRVPLAVGSITLELKP
jgi:hypothetical protein